VNDFHRSEEIDATVKMMMMMMTMMTMMTMTMMMMMADIQMDVATAMKITMTMLFISAVPKPFGLWTPFAVKYFSRSPRRPGQY